MGMHVETNGRIILDDVEDVVAYIGAECVRTIAKDGYLGHGLDAVAARILSDACLDTIRRAYVRRVEAGMPTVQALTETGVALISVYLDKHGLDPATAPKRVPANA